jgi:hypothetical protein
LLTPHQRQLSSSDLEVLSAGITALGGQWRNALTRDVTHLFALSSESSKYKTALHFQHTTNVIILLPHWFDDAVRLGVGTLPTTEYEWPEPKVLRMVREVEDEDVKRSKLTADKKALFKMAVWTPGKNVPASPANVRDIWQGRSILLSPSLGLSRDRREAVEAGIRRTNGIVVKYESGEGNGSREEEEEKIKEADVLITRYRTGAAYVEVHFSAVIPLADY